MIISILSSAISYVKVKKIALTIAHLQFFADFFRVVNRNG